MGMEIENEIGEFFGVHNLVEYKSPTDHNFNQCSICQALFTHIIIVPGIRHGMLLCP